MLVTVLISTEPSRKGQRVTFTHDGALFVEHCSLDTASEDFIAGHAVTMQAVIDAIPEIDPVGDFRALVAATPPEIVKQVFRIDDAALADIAAVQK